MERSKVFSEGLKLSLLSVALVSSVLAGCGQTAFPDKPDLPQSVSPGWTMKSYESAGAPEGLPAGAQPRCWKADYAGANQGSAEVWACGFQQESSAFNAMQRARAGANTLKFQNGRYLAVVRWNGGRQADLVALMRVLEGSLK
jgi:hypothetical protein